MQTTLFVLSFFGMFGGFFAFLYQLVRTIIDVARKRRYERAVWRRRVGMRAGWQIAFVVLMMVSAQVYKYNAPWF